MTDKFSYTDVLCYLMPGACAMALGLSWWATIPGSSFGTIPMFGDGGLLASVAFVLLSFVVGNTVQVIAHTLPEALLRRVFWSGWWPSDLAMFDGGPCLSTTEREAVKMALTAHLQVSAANVPVPSSTPTRRWGRRWSLARTPENMKATTAWHGAFDRGRALLADTGAGTRATAAEAYYLFFRGMMVVCGVGGAAFSFLALNAPWKAMIGLPPSGTTGAVIPSGVLLSLALLFAWRARGAGEGFARETFLALSVLGAVKALGQRVPEPSTPSTTP